MPRKLRNPKTRLHEPLVPAAMWTAMTGEWHGEERTGRFFSSTRHRLGGWLETLQAIGRATQHGVLSREALAEQWREHIDDINTQAAAYGFRPWIATGQLPTGTGFEQWATEYASDHAY